MSQPEPTPTTTLSRDGEFLASLCRGAADISTTAYPTGEMTQGLRRLLAGSPSSWLDHLYLLHQQCVAGCAWGGVFGAAAMQLLTALLFARVPAPAVCAFSTARESRLYVQWVWNTPLVVVVTLSDVLPVGSALHTPQWRLSCEAWQPGRVERHVKTIEVADWPAPVPVFVAAVRLLLQAPVTGAASHGLPEDVRTTLLTALDRDTAPVGTAAKRSSRRVVPRVVSHE